MTNLTSRIISAVVALILFTAIIYYFGQNGIYGVIVFAVARGSYELARMLFKNDSALPKYSDYLFVVLNTITFILLTQEKFRVFSLFIILLCFACNVCFGILFHKKFRTLESIFSYISQSAFGCLYIAVIPACIAWTVYAEQGLTWFFCLLTVVFAGDIGAYLFGMTLGTVKIAPTLSPKKSVQGAIGGLIFSTLAAYVFSFYLPHVPLVLLLTCGFFGGLLGQIGDFFESLIKRVAGVKDSGSIMPGHGGVLDRIDGVLLASPLFYFAANYHSLWS